MVDLRLDGQDHPAGFEGIGRVFFADEFTACSRAPRGLRTKKAVGLSSGGGFPADAITRWQRLTHSSQINTLGPAMRCFTSPRGLPQNEQYDSGSLLTFKRNLLTRS
jgi:hypothetical protein